MSHQVADLVYYADQCWKLGKFRPITVGIVVQHNEVGFNMPYEVMWRSGVATRHWEHELVSVRDYGDYTSES